ncbi:MAG: hypothetical protein K9K37_11180 [Desulfocapsa sp.]|nr:hypothetical protein [Desulfocapsa sp.]
MARYSQISVIKERILAAIFLGIVPGFSLENSQIGGYDELYQLFDYNRLRAELTLEHEDSSNLSARLIVDNETYYKNDPGSLVNRTSIYRAYMEYSGAKHLWLVGKQRIPLGVGRFWNPIDVFNPIDIEAIETDQRPGTNSIRYEYAMSELSNIDVTVADGKGAIRVKGYLGFADVALVGEWDEDQDRDIIGWEIEGELANSGIELRSEGGSFHNRQSGQRHTEFIVGTEYGFENSLVLMGEYHYLDVPRRDELGVLASFQPAMLWTCSLMTVTDLDDGSGFVSPVIEYSLSDEMTLSGGAFVYHGAESSSYGQGGDHFYVRWFVHF